MQIMYVGPMLEVEFQGIVCKQGEPVNFPDAIAKQALEQDVWVDPSADEPDAQPPAAPAEDDPSTPTFNEHDQSFVAPAAETDNEETK